jgi:hypothetical protein
MAGHDATSCTRAKPLIACNVSSRDSVRRDDRRGV